ncbi:MAG: hypothetical protein K9H48_07625 [Melioribacteraceae bacterium]|nr:hypothetical protein [Melioribacteraceae bacterium]
MGNTPPSMPPKPNIIELMRFKSQIKYQKWILLWNKKDKKLSIRIVYPKGNCSHITNIEKIFEFLSEYLSKTQLIEIEKYLFGKV